MDTFYSAFGYLDSRLGVTFLSALVAACAAFYRFRRKRVDTAQENAKNDLSQFREFSLQFQEYFAARHSALMIVIECLDDPKLRSSDNWQSYRDAIRDWNRRIFSQQKILTSLEKALDIHAPSSFRSLASVFYNSENDTYWETLANQEGKHKLELADDLKTPDCVHFSFWLAHRHVTAALDPEFKGDRTEQRNRAVAAHKNAQKNWLYLSNRIDACLDFGEARVEHLESLSYRKIFFTLRPSKLLDIQNYKYPSADALNKALSAPIKQT